MCNDHIPVWHPVATVAWFAPFSQFSFIVHDLMLFWCVTMNAHLISNLVNFSDIMAIEYYFQHITFMIVKTVASCATLEMELGQSLNSATTQ